MNSFSLTEKFKDQSNYLVAFVAAVIGLGAFQDNLSKVHVHIFNAEPTLFNLAVPIVVVLLVATYLSALTLLVDNINFTLFPLKGSIQFLANLVGAVALTAPLFFLLLWGVSELVTAVSSSQRLFEIVTTLVAGITGVLGFLVVYRITRRGQKRQTQADALRVVSNSSVDMIGEVRVPAPSARKSDPQFEFMKKYQEVMNHIKDYLDVTGYSVKNAGFVDMARILASKSIMSEDDLRVAESLAAARNDYAHGRGKLSRERIEEAEAQLDHIYDRVSAAFWALITDQDDATVNGEA